MKIVNTIRSGVIRKYEADIIYSAQFFSLFFDYITGAEFENFRYKLLWLSHAGSLWLEYKTELSLEDAGFIMYLQVYVGSI